MHLTSDIDVKQETSIVAIKTTLWQCMSLFGYISTKHSWSESQLPWQSFKIFVARDWSSSACCISLCRDSMFTLHCLLCINPAFCFEQSITRNSSFHLSIPSARHLWWAWTSICVVFDNHGASSPFAFAFLISASNFFIMALPFGIVARSFSSWIRSSSRSPLLTSTCCGCGCARPDKSWPIVEPPRAAIRMRARTQSHQCGDLTLVSRVAVKKS